jgi:uncharacterized repeat protein (TIGR03803 family)
MILGRDGIFYGVTTAGGASVTNFSYGYGTVFKFAPGGPLVTLHCFNNTDGAGPLTISQGVNGDLYGVTEAGGETVIAPFGGYGTVFRITTNGVFTKLGDCDSATKLPLSIVQATDGRLYGSAAGGSVASIFRVDPGGMIRVVYSFESYGLPGFLVQMPGGSIYGTSRSGGPYREGTIFRLDVTADAPLLRMASVQTNQLALSWNASVGRSYQLQGCGDVFQAGWTNVGGALMATNAVVSVSVANASQGCFYRVVLLP